MRFFICLLCSLMPLVGLLSLVESAIVGGCNSGAMAGRPCTYAVGYNGNGIFRCVADSNGNGSWVRMATCEAGLTGSCGTCQAQPNTHCCAVCL
ncbi:hypothetical protein K493DRAFT_321494 [Basidiobolus meristosporus CBS 931.73]|uniref:Secreted protein n=1 Tax=Basidiobolus meristosporus CBS 931.73 TaxID=1314790 RepID=A0A1Y1WTK8_9FUNG|nr:hypothetical protein K493DRAFT_321494 [Basidiobolus meristosporus CBS 931.73]|eukprot:ORX76867.1 hypothetical protein K493DRAFT_321494 [Basidiobolus meristosporus CBS 931.73]